MSKAKKAKKAKPEKGGNPVPAEKPEKVKKARKPKSEAKPKKAKGINWVDLVTGFPEESASCAFEAATGRLTLRIPPPLDGMTGPQGEAGKGLDYSHAPGGRDEFFLFVDEAGRLCYSAWGKASLVSLAPMEKGDA
jgi:hypothetical protein